MTFVRNGFVVTFVCFWGFEPTGAIVEKERMVSIVGVRWIGKPAAGSLRREACGGKPAAGSLRREACGGKPAARTPSK